MEVAQIGKNWYTQKLYYQKRWHWPVSVERTVETESPYRIGKCLVLSLPPFKTAWVFGRWVDQVGEDTALSEAVGYRVMDEYKEGPKVRVLFKTYF